MSTPIKIGFFSNMEKIAMGGGAKPMGSGDVGGSTDNTTIKQPKAPNQSNTQIVGGKSILPKNVGELKGAKNFDGSNMGYQADKDQLKMGPDASGGRNSQINYGKGLWEDYQADQGNFTRPLNPAVASKHYFRDNAAAVDATPEMQKLTPMQREMALQQADKGNFGSSTHVTRDQVSPNLGLWEKFKNYRSNTPTDAAKQIGGDIIKDRVTTATQPLQDIKRVADTGTWAQKLETGVRMGGTGQALSNVDSNPGAAALALNTQQGQQAINDTSAAIKDQGVNYGDNTKMLGMGGLGLLGVLGMMGMGGGGGQQQMQPGLPPEMRGASNEEDPYEVKNFNYRQYE
jgi:hypothetical protein